MNSKAKPFIKWVGGKGQLIEQLEAKLPADFDNWENATYIEPFVGGGAMLFYMLQQHPNIKRAVINDINSDLVTCYRTVRDNVEELIPALQDIQAQYYALQDMEAKREMFMAVRQRYNEKNLDPIENTAKFFFLNRTCFNGLYRVNKKGLFNVPCGKYMQPQICDEDTLRADSELLKRVEILEGDFEKTLLYAQGKTLFYFDPPYRPLSDTSSFNDYTKEAFNDDSQVRLKEFCDKVVAVRTRDKKKILDSVGNCVPLESMFSSVDSVMTFLTETGLGDVLQNQKVKNLVDYVFGIETELDTNARKNRSGHVMENTVANIFTNAGIPFRQEVYSREWSAITDVLGDDEKRFDFVVETSSKVYLIEVNFYSGGGSKLNEVARSYSDIAPKINSVEGFEFVWITDGIGWKSAKNKLQEAYGIIPSVYNLTSIQDFIKLVTV